MTNNKSKDTNSAYASELDAEELLEKDALKNIFKAYSHNLSEYRVWIPSMKTGKDPVVSNQPVDVSHVIIDKNGEIEVKYCYADSNPYYESDWKTAKVNGISHVNGNGNLIGLFYCEQDAVAATKACIRKRNLDKIKDLESNLERLKKEYATF